MKARPKPKPISSEGITAAVFIAILGVAYLLCIIYMYREKKNRRPKTRLRLNSESSLADRKNISDSIETTIEENISNFYDSSKETLDDQDLNVERGEDLFIMNLNPNSTMKFNFKGTDLSNSTSLNNCLLSIVSGISESKQTLGSDINFDSINLISLANCSLNSNGFLILSNTLINPISSSVLYLDLSYNHIDSESSIALGQLIEKNESLAQLKLKSCFLGDEEIYYIAKALRYSKSLKSLNLSNNQIEKGGCRVIASSLGYLKVVEDEEAAAAAAAVQSLHSPKRDLSDILFDSSRNNNNPAMIKKTKSLGDLDFSDPPKYTELDTISDKKSKSTKQNKKEIYNQTLEILNLSGNAIGSSGAIDLANALLLNNTLTHLDLGYQTKGTKIGPSGATQLSLLIRRENSPLKILKLARGNIGFEGCRHLSSALLINKTLTELDISGVNYMTIAGAMQLAQAIYLNRSSRLAWLSIGEKRLPIAALVGDRIHSNSSNIKKSKGDDSNDNESDNQRQPTKRASRRFTFSLSFNAQDSPSSLLPNPEVFNPVYMEEGSMNNFYTHSRALSMHPKTLRLMNITLTGGSKNFIKTTAHGMHDEMAVVVYTLLKKNKTLESLCIDNAYIPIQTLLGHKKIKNLDLSDKKLTSSDTIVIGGLLADNPHVRKLNLKNNNFARSEGENFIAYALERNPLLNLDLAKWPAGQMFADGYATLASLQGISASGAAIEPQRLEGWFYQGLTAYSAILFYIDLASTVLTIEIFASKPEIYSESWLIGTCILLCLPTVFFGYNTFNQLIAYNTDEAIYQTFLILFQIKPAIQAYECIEASMESTDMLDYKYVQAVYKSVPSIFLKTYIMFRVGITDNAFDAWILSAILTSLLGITVIFIMLFDRKAARRISMASLEHQPWCAIWLAKVFACTGMGTDSEHVEDFVNFDAYYTSHYVWSYVYQCLSIMSRVVSASWLLAAVGDYAILMIFLYFYSRYLIMLLFDDMIFKRTFFANMVDALSLSITDSAWRKIPDDPEYSRFYFVGISFLSTLENFMAILFTAFIHQDSLIKHDSEVSLFIFFTVITFFRWVMLIHWTIVIHFPELYVKHRKRRDSVATMASDNTDIEVNLNQSVEKDSKSNIKSKIKKLKSIGWNPADIFSSLGNHRYVNATEKISRNNSLDEGVINY